MFRRRMRYYSAGHAGPALRSAMVTQRDVEDAVPYKKGAGGIFSFFRHVDLLALPLRIGQEPDNAHHPRRFGGGLSVLHGDLQRVRSGMEHGKIHFLVVRHNKAPFHLHYTPLWIYPQY